MADLTDLGEPRRQTRAIAATEWRVFASRHALVQPPAWDAEVIDLQIWSYDPRVIGDADVVDPISLWLSLPDSKDERYQLAKQQLLKKVQL